ncbi:MAG: hypothetical protein JW874_16025 [Spirochaetales bacterium]|nr:hypothetical protein [Spirochaetales bacterium]
MNIKALLILILSAAALMYNCRPITPVIADVTEEEPNGHPETAQSVPENCIIQGEIGDPFDEDFYVIDAEENATYAVTATPADGSGLNIFLSLSILDPSYVLLHIEDTAGDDQAESCGFTASSSVPHYIYVCDSELNSTGGYTLEITSGD